MDKHHYDRLNNIHESGMDEFDEEIELHDLENTDMKHHRNHARRSVDDYLESKRLRERYHALFDEDFE